jgi:4-carboxymuconolactone decarboxylase
MTLIRRWPALDFEGLDPGQQRMWNRVAVVPGRQYPAVDAAGHLLGPYDPLLRSPEVGERIAELGAHLRVVTEVPRRLQTVAIVMVGGYWNCEFMASAWPPEARAEGIDPDAVDALWRVEVHPGLAPDEAIVAEMTRQMLRDSVIAPETFAVAQELLGEAGLVEVATLVGYYCLIALLLGAFQTPLPEMPAGEQ